MGRREADQTSVVSGVKFSPGSRAFPACPTPIASIPHVDDPYGRTSVGPLRREEARRSSETRLFPLHRLRLLEPSYEKVLSHKGTLHHLICPKGGTILVFSL